MYSLDRSDSLTQRILEITDEVVEPSGEIYGVSDVGQKEGDLVGCPAYDESAAYHQ